MTEDAKRYAVEKTKELIEAASCCPEAKEAAKKWLAALGTPEERAESERYLAELEEDIEPIDDLLSFAGSEDAVKYFGREAAAEFFSHARQLKAAGARYCDCPACSAAAAILEKKSELL